MVYIDEFTIGAPPIDIAAGGDTQPRTGGDDVLKLAGAQTLGGNQRRNYMLY